MTSDDLRRRVAEHLDAEVSDTGVVFKCHSTYGDEFLWRYDLSTLDGVAALMRDRFPEWDWERIRDDAAWFARTKYGPYVTVPDTGDELHDRLALLVKIAEAVQQKGVSGE